MTLKELKQKEKELRKKYGDDLYEKYYIQQYNRERANAAAGTAITKPPVYAPPAAPISPNISESSQPPKARIPQYSASDNKTEDTSYTDKAKSGIMPNNLKSIKDFRGAIEGLDKRIADLNKQQFNIMLTGDGKKTAAFDGIIKNAERVRDGLKEQIARVMGIGSESADKDMLRDDKGLAPGGEAGVQRSLIKTPAARQQFDADEIRLSAGMNGGEDEAREVPKPEPLTESSVYVSEEDFDLLSEQLDQVLEERYSTDGPVVTPIDVNMKRLTLEQNRELSKRAEDAQGLYITEEDAAVAFSEVAVLETGGDYLERGAIIIGREVPVVDSSGQIVMETRYELGDTFIGKHDNVIEGLFTAYAGAVEDMALEGVTISFVHTHPYCSGHIANEFSGLKGDSIWAVAGEAAGNILNGEDFNDFGHYLGDLQVTWLPGVDRMYLASPTDKKLYACDDKGPIMDPNDPTKYAVFGQFKAFAPNKLQE